MSKKKVSAERLGLVAEPLEEFNRMTTAEIHCYLIARGIDGKVARSDIITAAFCHGITRRKKLATGQGYEYRLARRYPKFGTSYSETPKRCKTKEDIVEKCKATSRVYALDQMLKAARGGHAPAN